MKKLETIRDGLYKVLDDLISACQSMNRSLPNITLTPAQYQIFIKFNKPVNGEYFYRQILIKQVNR